MVKDGARDAKKAWQTVLSEIISPRWMTQQVSWHTLSSTDLKLEEAELSIWQGTH